MPMITAVRPVGSEWVMGTTAATPVTVSAAATISSYGHPTQFGGDGHTLYLKLDATSVGTDVLVAAYAHAAGSATTAANYAAISPAVVPDPTVLTTSWQAFDFSPPCTDYVGFVLTNREVADAVKVHAVYVHGG